MKPIKKRWKLWKTYTDKWEKAKHGFLVILSIALTVWGFSNGWILGVITLAFWANVTYTFTMKDVWGNAYQRTETLRATGWYLTKALKEWTFVKASKVGNHYYIDPDKPGEDPDEADDAMFTHEIVIRLGMDDEGEEITAYRIPDDMGLSSVVGALESVKLQYSYDVVGEDDE